MIETSVLFLTFFSFLRAKITQDLIEPKKLTHLRIINERVKNSEISVVFSKTSVFCIINH